MDRTNYVLVAATLALAVVVPDASIAQKPRRLMASRIAFTSARDTATSCAPNAFGNAEIYVMAPNGTDQTRLTVNTVLDNRAAWAPDGRRIAFHRAENCDDFGKILVMNADGSGEGEITAGLYPTWAPNGEAIGFQNQNQDHAGRFDIYSIAIDSLGNADPASLRNLTNTPGGDIHPNWSPDASRRIVFQSNRNFFNPSDGTYPSNLFELYVMNADGSNQVQFTCVGGWSTTAAWSPDGTKIAFGHLDPPTPNAPTAMNFNIYVKRADDTDCHNLGTRLTDNPRVDTKPSWSSNGAMIAFESVREVDGVVQGTQIYIMNSDGTNQVALTDLLADGRPNMSPSWGPLPR